MSIIGLKKLQNRIFWTLKMHKTDLKRLKMTFFRNKTAKNRNKNTVLSKKGEKCTLVSLWEKDS